MPEQPTQVIVPFDLDGDVAQACRHVCSAVTHFVNKVRKYIFQYIIVICYFIVAHYC